MTCPSCGAVAKPAAAWCGQCHASFVAASPVPAGRWAPAATSPVVVPVHSRWRGGPTSFGPVGRVSWTVAVLLVAAFALFSMDPFFIVIWIGVVGPVLLRSVWKRARIS